MPIPAARYTHGQHRSVTDSYLVRTAANSAAYLLPHLRAGQRLLDVGCGPGSITADLAELTAPGSVIALDASAEVLEQASARIVGRGLPTPVVLAADAAQTGLPTNSVDVAHAHQVLQHVGDPVAVLRELRRVLAPAGIVAARDADYAAFSWYPDNPGLTAWLDLYRSVTRTNGGEPDAGRRLRSWALRAGFDEVATSSSTWTYASVEATRWWSSVWTERITESPIAEQALAGGFAQRSDLDAIAEGWRDWGRAPGAYFAVVHGEILCRS